MAKRREFQASINHNAYKKKRRDKRQLIRDDNRSEYIQRKNKHVLISNGILNLLRLKQADGSSKYEIVQQIFDSIQNVDEGDVNGILNVLLQQNRVDINQENDRYVLSEGNGMDPEDKRESKRDEAKRDECKRDECNPDKAVDEFEYELTWHRGNNDLVHIFYTGIELMIRICDDKEGSIQELNVSIDEMYNLRRNAFNQSLLSYQIYCYLHHSPTTLFDIMQKLYPSYYRDWTSFLGERYSAQYKSNNNRNTNDNSASSSFESAEEQFIFFSNLNKDYDVEKEKERKQFEDTFGKETSLLVDIRKSIISDYCDDKGLTIEEKEEILARDDFLISSKTGDAMDEIMDALTKQTSNASLDVGMAHIAEGEHEIHDALLKELANQTDDNKGKAMLFYGAGFSHGYDIKGAINQKASKPTDATSLEHDKRMVRFYKEKVRREQILNAESDDEQKKESKKEGEEIEFASLTLKQQRVLAEILHYGFRPNAVPGLPSAEVLGGNGTNYHAPFFNLPKTKTMDELSDKIDDWGLFCRKVAKGATWLAIYSQDSSWTTSRLYIDSFECIGYSRLAPFPRGHSGSRKADTIGKYICDDINKDQFYQEKKMAIFKIKHKKDLPSIIIDLKKVNLEFIWLGSKNRMELFTNDPIGFENGLIAIKEFKEELQDYRSFLACCKEPGKIVPLKPKLFINHIFEPIYQEILDNMHQWLGRGPV